jgi:gliding motility-associated-like protein
MNDSAEVIRYAIPQISLQSTSISCFEEDDGSIITSITGGEEPYILAWSGPGEFSSSELNLAGLAPGEYSCSVTDSNLCMNTGPDVLISEPELLVASIEQVTHVSSYQANDGSIQLSVAGGTFPYTFVWTGSNHYESTEQNPVSLTLGNYDVMVTDDHLCQDSIMGTGLILEKDAPGIFIPEGFSPNGDGYNDLFVILGIENYSENELVIFNTQGVVVFHRINYKNDWDGTPETGSVLGGILPEGTYYYVFKFGETSVRKGFVYLNRE